MMMKKILFLCILSFTLSGCITPEHEKARDLESATTLQQKRDALLKWSPNVFIPLGSSLPSNAAEARKEYLKYKGEDNEFLNGLISKCYNSQSSTCAYDYYWSAAKLEIDKENNRYENARNDLVSKRNAELALKVKANPGDSFKCKLSITSKHFDEIRDSGIRVVVKDNGDRFVMYTERDEQIQSPILKENNDGTGLRVGFSDDQLMTGIAAYDGDFYQIDLKDEVTRRYIHTTMVRSAIPYLINDENSYETSMILHAFKCNKIR
ncbi:hypothetical protein VYJ29_003812 [Yersinia enterocolitica]|uniref:hypothetical protein n=1 Tax=Yersinia intermedia TaxID=631 RepID=UPI0022FE9AC5|nr:hypothetical protein [Yersinia intermedia]ELI7915927.1 hypothetical protein [Yersinia enterocolitica]ELI7925521.1 hypothetical protein [Yersinia enterocolitica]ELI7957708.1 hypothetical protein [Yersinia enterocolitica]ELI8143093.1 hypothetical protein [Yersinia enterocolitica]ELI8184217.1 hypothetical protein [Yersinia enterocolitica]